MAKRALKWTAAAALVGVGLVAVVLGVLAWAFHGIETTWERPDPPTRAALGRLRATAPEPSYWLGPRTDRALTVARPISGVPGSIVITYGQFCEELDPGSGLSCTDHGEVVNRTRTPAMLRDEARDDQGMPVRRECWHAVGRAWVLACWDSWRASLWAADRVIEFSRPGADISDIQERRPWRDTLPELQRFGAGARGLRFPATTRLTCGEWRAVAARERSGIPGALRPRAAC